MTLEEFARIFDVHIEIRYPDVGGNWMYSLDGEIKVKSGCLSGEVGRGGTIEAARRHYLQAVRGKTVVFNAMSKEYRKEFTIPESIQ